MPVRKFRSIEEMDGERWRQPGDPELYRAIAAVWDLGRRLRPRSFPPGVQRFASIEAMSRAQETRADAHSNE